MEPILSLKGLSKKYNRKGEEIHLFDSLFLDLYPKTTLSIIGPSGVGKTTLAKILAGFIPHFKTLYFRGGIHPETPLREVQLVFQNPFESLTPHMRIKQLLQEGVTSKMKSSGYTSRINLLLHSLKLQERHLNAFPHQLSGGEAQRIALLRSLSVDPLYLICDEVLSALDTSLKQDVLAIIQKLQDQLGFGMLWITHDYPLAKLVSNEVQLLYKGKLLPVESESISKNEVHPYLSSLFAAVDWMEGENPK